MKTHALRKLWLYALLLILVLSTVTGICATETAPDSEAVEIWTVEDMLTIAEKPDADYILMADLDMYGIDWVGPDFTGSFNGNGHTILNLTLSQPGPSVRDTYDGNLKRYDSSFAGLFSTLENATVKDLTLLNVRGTVDTELSCFVGSIAGYTKESTISNCTVSGILELRAFDRMFGIGGLAGYGSGYIDSCSIDMTLICTDTQEARDEMFFGGVCGMGFFDITNCTVNLAGFASEYGYVHSGGLIGMLLRTRVANWTCTISDNSVNGKITFFECNPNRRAYCEPYIGEQMTDKCKLRKNTAQFKRDERKTYDVELRPETCTNPEYTATAVLATCKSYGYTTYQCNSCGYTYTDLYTLFGDHQVSQWNVVAEATVEKEGSSTGTCDHCGITVQRTEPKLDPPPTEPPTEPPTTTVPETTTPEAPLPEAPREKELLIPLVAVLIALIIALIVCVCKLMKPAKHTRRKRR